MKAKYINPFLNAAVNLFQVHLGISAKNLAPYINSKPNNLNEISAIIGLAGETKGAVVLSFTRETALKIVSRFSGQKYSAITQDVIDGVGELTNILAGNAKKDLMDFKIVISLPGIVTSTNGYINWPKGILVITIPFESEFGNFSVIVSLRDIV